MAAHPVHGLTTAAVNTMSSTAGPSPTNVGDVGNILDGTSGKGSQSEGQSFGKFIASLLAGIVVFAIQFLLFYLLKSRWTRI